MDRFILIVKNPDSQQIYSEVLSQLPINIDIVSDFMDAGRRLSKRPYKGVFLDVITKMKGRNLDNESLIENIMESFPVLQLKVDQGTSEIRGMFNGATSIEEFVNVELKDVLPRKLRIANRKYVHLNMLIAKDPGFKTQVERTISVDVSKSGMFIFTTQPYDVGSNVYCIINSLTSKIPIEGEIRRVIPWGDLDEACGIGIRFQKIEKAQLEEVWKLCAY